MSWAGDEFHAGLGEVAAFGGDGPFVVDLDQDRSGEPQQGGGVGEDADDFGAAFYFAVDPLQRVGNGYEGVSVTGSAGVLPLVVGVGAGLRCDRPGRGALGVTQGLNRTGMSGDSSV